MKALPVRTWVGAQLFFATFMSYMLRANLPVSIIAMVHQTNFSGPSTSSECIEATEINTTISEPDYGSRYDWDADSVGLALGAYFYGYLIANIPGGAVAERYGGRIVIFISIVGSGCFTLLTPLCAHIHYGLVFVVRFFIGLFSGVIFPSCHCMISKWAPPDEKGKFVACLFGSTIGAVVTWPFLGVVITTIGWVWSFYLTGIVGIAWGFSWYLVVHDSPDKHRWIKDDEKQYIENSLAGTLTTEKRIPPYLKIFRNLPFWCLVLAHFGNLWGVHLLSSNGPMFLNAAMGFNIQNSGTLASLPYLFRMIFALLFGQIADTLRKKEIVSATTVRKFFTLFSHVLPGLLLYGIALSGCNAIFVVGLLTLSLGLNGASAITSGQNSQDLAPNYAGTIYGISNCIGSMAGFITPSVYAYLTSRFWGLQGFHYVFILGASVYIGCGVIFMIFGTAQIQSFNDM